jgi:alcohol dehydrogenase
MLGESSFRNSAFYPALISGLTGFSVTESEAVPANPRTDFLDQLAQKLKGSKFDAVLAIGGGSVLDTAKAASVMLNCAKPSFEWLAQNKDQWPEPIPVIAVPTTSGTGSEVTPYASFETSDQRKVSLESEKLYPHTAWIDPKLCMSMKPYVTACTGMDAFCQSVESFWSVQHHPFSDAHALRGLKLVAQNLAMVFKNPNDEAARYAMCVGSCEAGLAIAQTRTTAVHSVSYPITAHFKIAHGHACALTLAEFIRYNKNAIEPARAQDLWSAMGCSDAESAAKFVENLMDQIGLERKLSKLGMKKSDLDIIIQNGFRPDRVKNNPRVLTQDDLREILSRLY